MNRADRMLESLLDGEPRSRAELHAEGGFYLTNNAASELRERGYSVEQWRERHAGRNVYFYRLTELPESPLTARTGGDSGSSGGVGKTAVSSTAPTLTVRELERRPLTPPRREPETPAPSLGVDGLHPEAVSGSPSGEQLSLLEAA